MKTEHAPGPWWVEPHDNYIPEDWDARPVQVVDANGDVVACNTAFYPTSLDPKNAPIIAAAPEMLAALKAAERDQQFAVEWMRRERMIPTAVNNAMARLENTRAAIAKAEAAPCS